jgi:hypothetical protein
VGVALDITLQLAKIQLHHLPTSRGAPNALELKTSFEGAVWSRSATSPCLTALFLFSFLCYIGGRDEADRIRPWEYCV